MWRSDSAAAEFGAAANLFAPIFSGDRSAPDYGRILSEIRTTIGQEPQAYALAAYDAVVLVARAVHQVGGLTTPGEWRDALQSTAATSIGASGHLTLNQAGDRQLANYDYWTLAPGPNGIEWQRAGAFLAPDGDYSSGSLALDR